ncbi:hypothetical protein PROFUN_09851 [Planoprotostelium fungivorum]|uniref:Uncharacterized protein n=1 Tax=Planoprotostelium fungivorum TaxID=1890364 RepID=A0A2P6NFM1_9EUKA|nr:hypothetical protein PROFUN_09851 [Planoprotostelium fungivorum]
MGDIDEDMLIRRMTNFKNPFDVMDISKTATVEEIQANDAFDALKKALQQLENEAIRLSYLDVMALSQKKTEEEWKGIGKVKAGEDDPEFTHACKLMTQKILIERANAAKKAEEYALANEKRQKEDKMKEVEKKKVEEDEEKKWVTPSSRSLIQAACQNGRQEHHQQQETSRITSARNISPSNFSSTSINRGCSTPVVTGSTSTTTTIIIITCTTSTTIIARTTSTTIIIITCTSTSTDSWTNIDTGSPSSTFTHPTTTTIQSQVK